MERRFYATAPVRLPRRRPWHARALRHDVFTHLADRRSASAHRALDRAAGGALTASLVDFLL